MGRPKMPQGQAKDRTATVRLDPATRKRLERLQKGLGPVELTLGQVLRAVIDKGLDVVERARQ
jgi:predicted DNA-binding protein